ncbi:MAG: protein kinase, partial [Gemmatimonadales bacterium]|nr:protein kinase [Gemmatimonadales bacterium]
CPEASVPRAALTGGEGKKPSSVGPCGRQDMLGKSIGGFEILEQIGRGGMGVVYRARQLSLEREVALKTLLPGLALDEALVERFQAEARAASRTNHPNLVQLYDVG